MSTDFRVAVRSLARHPVQTLVIIAINGILAGLAVALFAAFDGLLFRPLPFTQADRTVYLYAPPAIFRSLPADEARAFSETARSLPLLARRAKVRVSSVFEPGSVAVVDWRLQSVFVSPGFFELFSQPALGRSFTDADAKDQTRPVIIGHDVWTTQFRQSPSVVGQRVTIDGTEAGEGVGWTIVGVMPPGFDFPSGSNFWIPHDGRFAEDVDVPTYAALSRDATVDQVRSALPRVQVTPLRESMRPEGATALGYLLAASTLLLVSVWLQVAGLLLGKAAARLEQAGVRSALGASRWQLIRPITFEAGLLVAASLLVALSTSALILQWILRVLPISMTLGQHVTIDLRAAGFGALVACAASAGFVALFLGATRSIDSMTPLRQSPALGGMSPLRARSALLLVQFMSTTALLYCAGLAWKSVEAIGRADLGFNPRGLVAVRLPGVSIPSSLKDRDERRREMGRQEQLYQDARDAIQAVAGVQSVTLSSKWPLENRSLQLFPVQSLAGGAPQPIATRMRFADKRFLRTVGGVLVDGRDFSDEDTNRSVLVNATFARALAVFGPVVGATLGQGGTPRYTVVGVVRDLVSERPGEAAAPELFTFGGGPVLIVRVTPAALAGFNDAVRQQLEPIWGPRTPRQVVDLTAEAQRATADFRARRAILTVVAAVALPVVILGLLGSLVSSIRTRRAEIALRLALGGALHHIRSAVWRGTLRACLAGVGFGLGLGWFGAIAAQRYLYQTPTLDWQGVAVSIAVLLLPAFVAAEFPIRRAAGIPLIGVLRAER